MSDQPAAPSGEEQNPSSVLRSRIKAENIKLPQESRIRSGAMIWAYALRPWFLIAGSAALSRFAPGAWYWWLPAHFILLLAAHRCFVTLVHDSSHKLFSSKGRINDLLANLMAAGSIGMTVEAYRAVHIRHHAYNGSERDPEHVHFEMIQRRGGVLPYMLHCITCGRLFELVRKYYLPSKPGGSKAGDESAKPSMLRKIISKWPMVTAQLAILAAFHFGGGRWYLYLLWGYLAVSWSPMLSSLRFVVEHPGKTDHTVSTTSWWAERQIFAPYNFNYHMEHHLWPSVPPYRLAQVHKYLRSQGYYDRHPDSLNSTYIGGLSKLKGSM